MAETTYVRGIENQEKILKAVQASNEELFKKLKVPKELQTPQFAQVLRAAAHDPQTFGVGHERRMRDHVKAPGPTYRTAVSGEAGPPAPYEYIADDLESEYHRIPDRSRYSNTPFHAPVGESRHHQATRDIAELNARTAGYTPRAAGFITVPPFSGYPHALTRRSGGYNVEDVPGYREGREKAMNYLRNYSPERSR